MKTYMRRIHIYIYYAQRRDIHCVHIESPRLEQWIIFGLQIRKTQLTQVLFVLASWLAHL